MNLTKVRLLTRAMVVVAVCAAAPAAAQAKGPIAPPDRVTIALMPPLGGAAAIADAGFAVGLMSAGHGVRTPAQTFLDIGQGARTSDSLYDGDLPRRIRIGPRGVRPRDWAAIRERAAAAPADIVPGLFASSVSLEEIAAEPDIGLGALIAANRSGRFASGASRVRVVRAKGDDIDRLGASAGPRHLIVAIGEPGGAGQRLVPIGIAGPGYHGVLESRTTRLEGLVSSIDVAPTVLDFLGEAIPGQMEGRLISSSADGDPESVAELRDRLLELSPRRTPVVWANVGIWVVLAAAASLALGARGRLLALPWLAVTLAALPAMLLAGAALEPSELAERLLVGLGSPLLALGLLRFFGPYAGFALAAGLSVSAYAVDVIAGSSLTALTVGGSNPSSGVRFFGIGNEHEAALSVLVVTGTGAALARWWPSLDQRRAAIAFGAVAALAVLAFAPGRFGADVGAAITIPAGAAVAAASVLEVGRRGWIAVALAPFAGLAALIAIDLVSGGDAHLSRSVLDAKDSGDVAGVIESRLRLTWGSIERNASSPFLWAALALLAICVYYRGRVWRALAGAPRAALAGLAGGAASVLIGTLANDSGITVFVIGIWFVIPFAGLIWVAGNEPD